MKKVLLIGVMALLLALVATVYGCWLVYAAGVEYLLLVALLLLGTLRTRLADRFGLIPEGTWAPLWVVDFPMFEYDDEAERYTATHHPFTAPKDGHEDWMVTAPEKCISKGYDMVLNGWEMGGGSVRIHRADVQQKVFDALKITPEEAQIKFGFLLDALNTAPLRTVVWPLA